MEIIFLKNERKIEITYARNLLTGSKSIIIGLFKGSKKYVGLKKTTFLNDSLLESCDLLLDDWDVNTKKCIECFKLLFWFAEFDDWN